ncbi:MAG TPA: class D sortase, partial [Vicinamibacteria bacterium]
RHGLLAVGLVCGGTFVLAHLRAELFTRLEEDRLASVLAGGEPGAAGSPSAAAARTRVEARPGRAWGRFDLPRLGLSALVAEGVDDATLGVAIGHVPGSAFPGEPGNVALAGHRDTVFRLLEEVRPEDVLRLVTPDGMFEYRVEWLAIVDPGRTDVLASSDEPLLTLVTCYPFEYVGEAPLRYVVRARSMERAAPDA